MEILSNEQFGLTILLTRLFVLCGLAFVIPLVDAARETIFKTIPCLSVVRVVVEIAKGGFYFSEPKSKKSRRKTPLSGSVVKALKHHGRLQLERKLKLGAALQDLDLVFAFEVATPLMRKNFTDGHFKPILKKSELPNVRLYDSRPTMPTMQEDAPAKLENPLKTG